MRMNEPLPEYLTCKEVAKILRRKRETIQAYVREGRLAGKKVGRDWLITPEAVRAFMAQS